MHLAQLNIGYVIRDGMAQYNTTTTRQLTVRLLIMFVVTNVHGTTVVYWALIVTNGAQ